MVQILHHGAVDGVTGSCHQLVLEDRQSLLVDCGAFQGDDTSPEGAFANDLRIDFSIEEVFALVCTHVHNDHVARIPFLMAAGFTQPIYCSYPSAILLPEVLRESLKMSGVQDKSTLDAYIDRMEALIKPLSYHQWHTVHPGLDIRLQPTGHILGASFVECRLENGDVVVFSGDLGCADSGMLNPLVSPERADILVIEATYGDRLHSDRHLRQIRLQEAIELAVRDAGTVLIPAFSLGRTQELLYELEKILTRQLAKANNGPWQDLAVIIDSPLATKFNRIYKALRPFWNSEARERFDAGARPFTFDHLITVEDHPSHVKVVQHLKQTARPAIVISASGMCSGGRILNYLKALLPDERTDILFVGYQASGTLGRSLLAGNTWVDIDGEQVPVRAQLHRLSGFSAHADRQGLLDFVAGMTIKPKQIKVVHGDDGAKHSLRKALRSAFPQTEVTIP